MWWRSAKTESGEWKVDSGKNRKLILAVDVGNTTVAVGIFSKKGRILSQTRFLTHSFHATTEWKKTFNQWLKNRKVDINTIETAILCSVVPISTFHFPRILVVGRDIKVPIVNRYKNPKQVGQDRLVNAYSGYVQYGSPLIIVDFGTAVTFDVVSKKGEYLGGLITPGLEMACQALSEKTALLPKVKVKTPKKIIGKTTEESIQSGLFYGWGALTDGVVAHLQKEIGPAKVILTGGQSQTISPFIGATHIVCPDLTLQGLKNLLTNLGLDL
ncbi:MAG: type III pantothenate kinase [Candidatus Omnitrophica bacterium]|nr:type III pantothenate kinase [Candidatus Omnitrophota bacterium]